MVLIHNFYSVASCFQAPGMILKVVQTACACVFATMQHEIPDCNGTPWYPVAAMDWNLRVHL